MSQPFSARVTTLRRRRGLSREELAERSGLSRQLIGFIESGSRTQFQTASLDALARALGGELTIAIETGEDADALADIQRSLASVPPDRLAVAVEAAIAVIELAAMDAARAARHGRFIRDEANELRMAAAESMGRIFNADSTKRQERA